MTVIPAIVLCLPNGVGVLPISQRPRPIIPSAYGGLWGDNRFS